MWYNYAALGLTAPLSGDAILEATALEKFIAGIGSNTFLYHGYYNLEKRDSFKNYEGKLDYVFDTVHIDMDSKDDGGALAWEQAKEFCKRLLDEKVNFQLYFSGNKGFHIAIHKSSIGIKTPDSHRELSLRTKEFLVNLKGIYSTVDTATFDPSRKLRAFRSKHEKSGLYKIRLTDAGLPYRLSLYKIDGLRNLAVKQQRIAYKHPTSSFTANPFLLSLHSTSEIQTPQYQKASIEKLAAVTEVESGNLVVVDAANFKNFDNKICVRKMMEGTVLPQFNRHDIEILLITELRQQGMAINSAKSVIKKWAAKVYSSAEEERIQDSERQVIDVYKKDLSKDQLYQYGCYGDIKKAYCSGRCKLYNTLDREKRARPLNCTSKQRKENDVFDSKDETGKTEKIAEGILADGILSEMPMLCKSNGQYFQWATSHWKRIDGPLFEDKLIKVAMSIYHNQANIKKVKDLVSHVIAKIPVAPENNHFFIACPNKFNFTDCTANIISDNGNLRMEILNHNPNDYLSYCAPFPLKGEHKLPIGTEFKKYMAIRKDDVGEEGVRIIKQMLGAALIPYVPRIFFIEGITNAGKSTLAKLIKKLLGEENVSEVLPVLRRGGADRFNWEPSIGRLANVVLELPRGEELDVNTLKMIRDKSPISIDRKSQKHVKATLPFLHVYCCNQMPQSFEGNTGALNNRVTMLFFKPGNLNGSSHIVELAEEIWRSDAGSVLNAAREGLQDLIESKFHYFNGTASQQAAKEWQKLTDTIQLYFEDINNGEWSGPQWEFKEWEKGSVVYEDFKQWCTTCGRKYMGKHSFYKELEVKFLVPRKTKSEGGERFNFKGLVNSKNSVATTGGKMDPAQVLKNPNIEAHGSGMTLY